MSSTFLRAGCPRKVGVESSQWHIFPLRQFKYAAS